MALTRGFCLGVVARSIQYGTHPKRIVDPTLNEFKQARYYSSGETKALCPIVAHSLLLDTIVSFSSRNTFSVKKKLKVLVELSIVKSTLCIWFE